MIYAFAGCCFMDIAALMYKYRARIHTNIQLHFHTCYISYAKTHQKASSTSTNSHNNSINNNDDILFQLNANASHSRLRHSHRGYILISHTHIHTQSHCTFC